jgi:hypothetical protein
VNKTIEAFDKVRESATRLGESADRLVAHIDSMTAQHTPSQPVKQEPEYWEVHNGVCPHGVYRTEEQAEQVRFDKQKSHDLSGSLASFYVRPLYAAPVTEPEQEPVAIDWDKIQEVLSDVWCRVISADDGLDAIQDLIYAAPVDAKAIRAEALEEAANVCEAEQFEVLEDESCEPYNVGCRHCAAAIRTRSMK